MGTLSIYGETEVQRSKVTPPQLVRGRTRIQTQAFGPRSLPQPPNSTAWSAGIRRARSGVSACLTADAGSGKDPVHGWLRWAPVWSLKQMPAIRCPALGSGFLRPRSGCQVSECGDGMRDVDQAPCSWKWRERCCSGIHPRCYSKSVVILNLVSFVEMSLLRPHLWRHSHSVGLSCIKEKQKWGF